MRHSGISLTMGRYTHTRPGQQVEAVMCLPDLAFSTSPRLSTIGTGKPPKREKAGDPKTSRDRKLNTEKADLSSSDSAEERLRPAGLEPTTPGLGNRCSILLSYGRKPFQ